ncbi:MAG: InlB B-repeat-containing protein [Clostridia bacterium]|nr:InlB B-repeat-containing protein [Clostridia bacterium]
MKKKLLIASLILACVLCVFFLASCDGGNTDDNRPSYTVTFNPNGGSFDGELTIEVKEGDKIPEPPKPTKDGSIFSGWYASKQSSSKWNFETGTVTADVTLTAWYAGGGSFCQHEETVPVTSKSYAATCEKAGREYVKCVKCGLETFTNIPKLGHDLKVDVYPVTCAKDGYSHEYCTRGCGYDREFAKIPATGIHEYGNEYVTIIEPTMYTGGQEARICEVCGKQQIFDIPSVSEMEDLLWDIDIGNYTYTGGKYVNESFVNIAKTAGIFASSYYTVCTIDKAIDDSSNTFWCADTLADGAAFSGDTITISFAQKFDIGMISLIVPYYTSWELGEDCYVAYDLEALIDGEWTFVTTLSDKNAIASGVSGTVAYELDAPINTDSLRLTVKHSSRYTPAMIYDISVMAYVENTERVVSSLASSSSYSISGKYNSWASGAEGLNDGSMFTYWYTDYKSKAGTDQEVFATISFPDEMFVAAVQFAVPANGTKTFEIHYLSESGEWIKGATCEVVNGKLKTSGDLTSSGAIAMVNDGTNDVKRAIFTVDIEKFTSSVKLVVTKESACWESYVYEFNAVTATEQAVISSPSNPNGIETYTGCKHGSFKTVETVSPNCTDAGYTLVECYGCGLKTKTDAIDSYGHLWGEYEILTAASGKDAGTKHSVCQKPDCDAERITNYYNDYEDIKITTYKNNAPAAWAQTFDDGNYIGTYEWLIPKLQHYGWKATAVLSITFCDAYVENWQEYFETGVLDLGSHSYTHGGYYSGIISENSLLSDVHNAHYWFMSKFAGQRILGFATPNGATSTGTSEYVTGIMSSARNGGNSKYFYNLIDELKTNGYGQSAYVGSITVDEETGEVIFTQDTLTSTGEPVWISTRRAWGNMNSYISKSDQTEGPYVYVSTDGKLASKKYKVITEVPVIDEATGEQVVDENGNLVFEKLNTPIYEETSGGYVLNNGSYSFVDNGGTHSLIKLPNTYAYVANDELSVNYVYDTESNRLKDIGITNGTYRYIEIKDESGKLLDNYFEWVEVGSYDLVDGEFVFKNDNSGQYKMNHTALGSYEKGINEILSVGGMTVECLHEIGQSGTIWSTYTSTNSKFKYLDQTGIWVCSYTELIQYMKEQIYSTVETISRSENEVVFNITDTLDDLMFNYALTVEVDVDDSWTADKITATQNGEAVEFFLENGYVYVNAVPDRGNVVITYNA